jgi:hypothetical protein
MSALFCETIAIDPSPYFPWSNPHFVLVKSWQNMFVHSATIFVDGNTLDVAKENLATAFMVPLKEIKP